MATRDELNVQYSNLCAQLGHLVLTKLDLKATIDKLSDELNAINKKCDEYRLQRNALQKQVPSDVVTTAPQIVDPSGQPVGSTPAIQAP